MKKNKFSKNWIIKQKRDIYVKKSKLEGYRSRAVYKLQEINDKFKLIKNNSIVVDLGAAPGSWSQYISRNFNITKIISIDLKEIEPIKNLIHIKGDFTEENQKIKIQKNLGKKADLIISDMAVNTTGNKSVDSLVTGELCIEAMNFACEFLDKKGSFISKIFMGSTFNEIVALGKKSFKQVSIFKPPSSRKDSKENFIICRNLR